MLYNPPPHLRHLTHQQFLATPEGREQSEGMRSFFSSPLGGQGQNRPGTTEAGTRPAGSPRPQPQSMPPRPGQPQRGPTSRPGQAQPQQPQPQGTQYNPQQGGNFSAYSPQQPARPQARYAEGTSQEYMIQNPDTGPFPPQGSGGNFSAFDPNMANNAQAPRPPAFQASYGQLGGGFSDQPGTQQRDAFISQINNQLGQMQGQSRQQPMGAPQFDFARMFGQAGNMVQQGYQNPFSPPQRQGPPPGMAEDRMLGSDGRPVPLSPDQQSRMNAMAAQGWTF